MSMGLALSNALSGLRMNQRQAEIISNNIANAQTPGYSRKEAKLGSLTVAGEGRGVSVVEVRRAANELLARDARRERGKEAYFEVRGDALQTYVNEIGQPDEERSVSSLLARFEKTFQSLSDSPEDVTLQRDTVNAASDLVRGLNQTTEAISRIREDADAAIAADVKSINSDLVELEKVNSEVTARAVSGADVSELEDHRDRLIKNISEKLPVHAVKRLPNDVVLFTAQGVTLLDGKARLLTFKQTTEVDASLSLANGGLSGITVAGQDVTPGSGSLMAAKEGTMAGHFSIRDETMPQFQKQMDEITSNLISQFQSTSNDPSLVGGAPGLFTMDGLAHDSSIATQVVGVAGKIAVNSRVIPEEGGATWRLRDGIGATTPGLAGNDVQVKRFQAIFKNQVSFSVSSNLPTNATLGVAAKESVGIQHAARTENDQSLTAQSAIHEAVNTAKENATGVNVDEELQKLMLIEKSYAASAQIMNMVGKMLDELMNATR